jgi:SAM-dependent methyltransferase
MKALAHIRFSSLLDVGGGDGYTAALVRHIFGVQARACDISKEACNRAKEIFSIEESVADIQRLPFKNDEFDSVICSQTLEHVADVQSAVKELLRVSRNAVIITVPVESEEEIQQYVIEKLPHPHLHSFNTSSFNYIASDVPKILVKKIVSPILKTTLIDAVPQDSIGDLNNFWVMTYNRLAPLFRVLFNKYITTMLIYCDEMICARSKTCRDILFLIIKNEKAYSSQCLKIVSARQVIDFKVAYHYLKKICNEDIDDQG